MRWSRGFWMLPSNLHECLPRTNFWRFAPESLRIESARGFSAEMAAGFGYPAQHADQTCPAIPSGSPERSRQPDVTPSLANYLAVSSAFGTTNPRGHGLVRCAPGVD